MFRQAFCQAAEKQLNKKAPDALLYYQTHKTIFFKIWFCYVLTMP
jgi:hypothetical protein